jgi:hypothetical protein
LYFTLLSCIIIATMSAENAPSGIPSAAESIAALRARVAGANAAGDAAVAAATSRNNEIIAANAEKLHELNTEVADAPKPDPDLHRVMFPDQYS